MAQKKYTPDKRKQTEILKAAFLHHLAETGGNVLRSCELSSLARNTALRHRAKDPAFAEKWRKIKPEKKLDRLNAKSKSGDDYRMAQTVILHNPHSL